MKLILTTLVYQCSKCKCDTTFLVDRIKDIRKVIEVSCGYCEEDEME